jgi:hypothetical protein
MQCKCGASMIEREQVINQEPVKYKHCKSCTRNYVSKKEQERVRVLMVSLEEKNN